MTDIIKNAQLVPVQEFRRMDADGDGTVDRNDFLRAPHRLMAELGIPEESDKGKALLAANENQWQFLLSLGDADGDGSLSEEEYVAARTSPAFRSKDRPGKGEVCRTLFDLLDRDDDGSLDRDEFLRAADFLHMSAEEAGAYFTELDADGSGRLDSKEFLKAVRRFYTS
ncbi:EF-hand domain-containing protein [Streptomyces nondiastaticus]|uniref:EF-hand domain-containing protein n=1 Tax=Streptomyces nondiastaticus TaxID=3154512 RepID=UPI003444004E